MSGSADATEDRTLAARASLRSQSVLQSHRALHVTHTRTLEAAPRMICKPPACGPMSVQPPIRCWRPCAAGYSRGG